MAGCNGLGAGRLGRRRNGSGAGNGGPGAGRLELRGYGGTEYRVEGGCDDRHPWTGGVIGMEPSLVGLWSWAVGYWDVGLGLGRAVRIWRGALEGLVTELAVDCGNCEL